MLRGYIEKDFLLSLHSIFLGYNKVLFCYLYANDILNDYEFLIYLLLEVSYMCFKMEFPQHY